MTTIRKNMKARLMTLFDSMMLKKRVLIETINDPLKNVCQIDHTKHRIPYNFFVHFLADLVCYSMIPKKPSLNIRVTAQMRFPFSLELTFLKDALDLPAFVGYGTKQPRRCMLKHYRNS